MRINQLLLQAAKHREALVRSKFSWRGCLLESLLLVSLLSVLPLAYLATEMIFHHGTRFMDGQGLAGGGNG